MTPIDGGAEIRDFIAALETRPGVMPAAVGAVVLGLVVVLLLLLAVSPSEGSSFSLLSSSAHPGQSSS